MGPELEASSAVPPPGDPESPADELELPAQAGTRTRRRRTLFGILGSLTVLLVVVVTFGFPREDPQRVPAPSPDSGPPSADSWLSGASGEGVAAGDFAAWRGSDLAIAGTWADNNEGMVSLPQLRPGGEFGSWDESLDIAIGAISSDESWADAAEGAYDDRWRASLNNLRDLWGGRSGTLYIRFAHEMNGDWYDWAVDADNHEAFIVAWKRFRALQQEIFPESKLVFCVNRESVDNGLDWRVTFPGAEYADVLGVDYYNNFPFADSRSDWDADAQEVDAYGGPKGIEQHLAFARSVGLPLAIPEWSGNAVEGDAPAFMEAMHEFLAANAGDGPGEVLYDVLFNVDGYDGKFILYPETLMPDSAAAYQRLW